jgi:hypothetical protein
MAWYSNNLLPLLLLSVPISVILRAKLAHFSYMYPVTGEKNRLSNNKKLVCNYNH